MKNRKTRLEHDALLGIHRNFTTHTDNCYGETTDHQAPKAWTYAHEDPIEFISTREKVSLILFLIGVCTVAIFIIRFEISRRKKVTTYRMTDYYTDVPVILKQGSNDVKTSAFTSRETTASTPSSNSLDTLKTWR